MHLTLTDGRKIAMPRYYKEKIYLDSQRKMIGAKLRLKMVEEEIKKEEKMTFRQKLNKVQNDAGAFRKMESENQKSRNKI